MSFGGAYAAEYRAEAALPPVHTSSRRRLPGVATATRRSGTSASLSSSRAPTSTGQQDNRRYQILPPDCPDLWWVSLTRGREVKSVPTTAVSLDSSASSRRSDSHESK